MESYTNERNSENRTERLKHRKLPPLRDIGAKVGLSAQHLHKSEKIAINKMFNKLLEKHTFLESIEFMSQILNMPYEYIIAKLDDGNLKVMHAAKLELIEHGIDH